MFCRKGLVTNNQENSMTTTAKTLKALLSFAGTSDGDMIQQLLAAYSGLNGNSKFPTPPVDLATYKSGIDTFSPLVTDAADGGKKAITAKNKQRGIMGKQYTQLGHYVEAASNDDPAIFATSGFVPAPPKAPPQPLPPASIDWIDRGPVTGSVVVKPKSVPKALSYSVEYAVVTTPGTLPATWTTLALPGSKAVTISNLTPGATYAFQIRALGRLGYTDWSAPKTFICG
jgi:Fibronectin type III domain